MDIILQLSLEIHMKVDPGSEYDFSVVGGNPVQMSPRFSLKY